MSTPRNSDLHTVLHERAGDAPLGIDLDAVTREGGRRVRRRRVAGAVGGVAAAAAVAALTIGLAQGPTPRAVDPADGPSESASESAAESADPVLVTYPDPGVTITDAAQVARRLAETPASFQEAVAAQVETLQQESTCEGTALVGITVQRVRSDGFASVAVNDCGGYQALWVQADDGTWSEALGTQDVWVCSDLEALDFPSDVAGNRCADGTGELARYRHD
ncbi:hypothetical protein [Nocardioides bruguierae]|uniref:hypothetical protein n=1 Tax=Nocardioides bruguierae TaxID=2945102 RepID=UPI00202082B3|nr:hypothetical protein [Nocardioides bruguierae]MCL8024341.1 hypothetical protein [Nocardioides bruguierae]